MLLLIGAICKLRKKWSVVNMHPGIFSQPRFLYAYNTISMFAPKLLLFISQNAFLFHAFWSKTIWPTDILANTQFGRQSLIGTVSQHVDWSICWHVYFITVLTKCLSAKSHWTSISPNTDSPKIYWKIVPFAQKVIACYKFIHYSFPFNFVKCSRASL
jgi:hypothetical protein